MHLGNLFHLGKIRGLEIPGNTLGILYSKGYFQVFLGNTQVFLGNIQVILTAETPQTIHLMNVYSGKIGPINMLNYDLCFYDFHNGSYMMCI